MPAEKIIVKHHPSNKDWKEFELFYPEESANLGHIVCQTFKLVGDITNPRHIWEGHSEASVEYYHECEPVSKDLAERIAQATSGLYGTQFKTARKINWKKHTAWKW